MYVALLELASELNDGEFLYNLEALAWELRVSEKLLESVLTEFGLFVFSEDGKTFRPSLESGFAKTSAQIAEMEARRERPATEPNPSPSTLEGSARQTVGEVTVEQRDRTVPSTTSASDRSRSYGSRIEPSPEVCKRINEYWERGVRELRKSRGEPDQPRAPNEPSAPRSYDDEWDDKAYR